MTIEDIGKMAQSGKPLFGIHTSNHEQIVIFGGDVPITRGETVICAIRSSGGAVDQDFEIVDAAVAAFVAEKGKSSFIGG